MSRIGIHSTWCAGTHAWTSYVSNLHKTANHSIMHIQTLVLLALPASLKVHSLSLGWQLPLQ